MITFKVQKIFQGTKFFSAYTKHIQGSKSFAGYKKRQKKLLYCTYFYTDAQAYSMGFRK